MTPSRDAALIAPSGPVKAGTFSRGCAALERLAVPFDASGVTAWPDGSDPPGGAPWLAGPDEERAARLRDAVARAPAALWMARGGYGAIRTLRADRGAVFEAGPPTPLWAFSDGTALLAAWDRAGWPAWHAPPVIQLARLDEISLARVRAAWHAGHVAPFEGLTPVSSGRATAPLAGGNLCVLCSLVGTPWAAELANRVVLIEDTSEPSYKVDRMLTQLELAGAFDDAAAVVFGGFTSVTPEETARIDHFLDRWGAALSIPVARGLPIGHDKANAPVPYGRGSGQVATLDVSADGATLSFGPA